jgi:fumarate reductase flavoprotein subunit
MKERNNDMSDDKKVKEVEDLAEQKLKNPAPDKRMDNVLEKRYALRTDMVPERKYSFEAAPDPIPDSDIKETLNTEVVVVGCGISGMTAALSAVEAGARVVLIEKAKSAQGFGGGNGAIDSRLQKKMGVNIDKEEFIRNLMKYSGNRADQRLVRMWAYDSGKTMDWLMDIMDAAGLETILFMPTSSDRNEYDLYPSYPTCHGCKSETLVVKCLLDVGIKKGLTARFSTRARQLIREENGRITGVIAQDEKGGFIRINAKKAVVLCTGDYGNNSEMVAKYCPQVGEMGTRLRTATGDGHQMALWVGGMMEPAPHATMTHGMAGPLGCTPFLQVNIKGERFQNEDVPMEMYVPAVRRQPGQVAWQIFDSKYLQEIDQMGFGLGKVSEMNDEVKRWVEEKSLTANTVEELALKMEVPVQTFSATIARYNELARIKNDMDFGKCPDRMTTVDKPPYFAGKSFIWFLCAMGGLIVNPKMQALNKDWEVIPGLYLGGNLVGNRYGVEYPTMAASLSNGWAMHLGRVAGINAATLEP